MYGGASANGEEEEGTRSTAFVTDMSTRNEDDTAPGTSSTASGSNKPTRGQTNQATDIIPEEDGDDVSTLNEDVTPPSHSSMESTGAKPKKGTKTKALIA